MGFVARGLAAWDFLPPAWDAPAVRAKPPAAKRRGRRTISAEMVLAIKAAHKELGSYRKVARRFGISPQYAHKIIFEGIRDVELDNGGR